MLNKTSITVTDFITGCRNRCIATSIAVKPKNDKSNTSNYIHYMFSKVKKEDCRSITMYFTSKEPRLFFMFVIIFWGKKPMHANVFILSLV